MAARDTTAWRHAIIQRKVINLDHAGNRNVMCAWDTCEKDGYATIIVRVKTHQDGYDERYMNYVFCTERHKAYWLASMRSGNGNNLPPGMKLAIV